MIRLRDVRKTFNQGKPNEFTAVRDVSLDIGLGDITVLRGPSGSGKTSLLCLLGCMTRPTAGRIHLQDREITSLPERFLAEIRRTTFGFVFQSFNLIEGMTALENVLLPSYPLGKPHAEIVARARTLLARFRMERKEDTPIEALSGGEKQRTAIARALMNDPGVIIADEPTAQLDSELAAAFMDMAAELNSEGKTLIIASHDPLVFDSPAVHRVVSIRDGAVQES